MFLQQTLIFLIFLCPLIFFHEMGHFLFAKFFGVRVEVFSIGFGPKLLSKKWGETLYTFSLIPLGGYVKMYGDDPFIDKDNSAATPIDPARSHIHRKIYQKFWIVFGGPLANFILAFVLFFMIALVGEKSPQMKLGYIPNESLLYLNGLRSGDEILEANQKPIFSLEDLAVLENKIESVTVSRQTKDHTTEKVTIKLSMTFERFLDEYIGHTGPLRKPLFSNTSGQIFELVQVDSSLQKSSEEISLEQILSQFEADSLIKNNFVFRSINKDKTKAVSEVKYLGHENEFYPLDLVVSSVVMNAPADKIGLKSGDILTKLNGESVQRFDDLRGKLQLIGAKPVKLTILRTGKEMEFSLTPEEMGKGKERVVTIGIYSSIVAIEPKLIEIPPLGFADSITRGMAKTWDGVVKTLIGFKKIITREMSLKSLGGPLSIGKVASDSWDLSMSVFFKLMALISVNLGIVNLFPIPVLDGGHIVLLLFEVVNRGPLSRKKSEYAQRAGFVFLSLLILLALVNDFSRFLL